MDYKVFPEVAYSDFTNKTSVNFKDFPEITISI